MIKDLYLGKNFLEKREKQKMESIENALNEYLSGIDCKDWQVESNLRNLRNKHIQFLKANIKSENLSKYYDIELLLYHIHFLTNRIKYSEMLSLYIQLEPHIHTLWAIQPLIQLINMDTQQIYNFLDGERTMFNRIIQTPQIFVVDRPDLVCTACKGNVTMHFEGKRKGDEGLSTMATCYNIYEGKPCKLYGRRIEYKDK